MQNQRFNILVSLLLLSLIAAAGVAAQTPQPSTNPLDLVVEAYPTAPLLSDDLLAPGCELTSAEAGVYQVECDEDVPPTTSIPALDGELLAPGCELTNPEAGVFILDCETEPFEPVPMSPAPLLIQPGIIGDNPPLDRAPQAGVCDGAAGSYVGPGMEAIRSTLISFDDIVYNNQDEELVQFALFAMDATQFLAVRNRFASPDQLDSTGPFNDGDIVTIGDQNACISSEGFTARLWQLDSGEWVFDTITSTQAVDMSSSWPNNIPDPQNPGEQLAQPQFPVLVDGVLFRYLMPYIEPPVTTIPGADQVDSDLPASVNACEYGAPSFLAIGMDVMVTNYGYERRASSIPVARDFDTWTLLDSQTGLTFHGTEVNQEILQTTPLTGIPGNIESVIVPASEMTDGIRIGTVIDGPFCSSINAEPAIETNGIVEAPDPDSERFYTWWQVDFGAETGWYLESAGQYSFWVNSPRKLFLYYMTPFNAMMQPECPTPGLFAGQSVQPAAGAMNLRATPNGDVIGRVDVGQPISIFGDPTCEGGTNWWQTDRGGFIAEYDPDGGFPLLTPYVPPVVTEEPTREPDAPQQPARPSDDDDDDDDNDGNDSSREPDTSTGGNDSSREPDTSTGGNDSSREPDTSSREPDRSTGAETSRSG